jgi:hypothetical protein
MEKSERFWYAARHETTGNRPAAGTAAPTGHSAAQGGQESVGSCSGPQRIGEFRVPLVPDGPQGGGARPAAPAHARPPAQALRRPEAPPGQGAPPGSLGRRVSDRSLDAPARGRGDRSRVWYSVPPLPCVEAADRPRVELPEARAAGAPTGRSGHRAVEAEGMAPDKKNSAHLGPISSSWTKAGSSSFPTSVAPGPPKAGPRSCTISTSKTGSRSSAPWPYRPDTGGWPSISAAEPGISPGSMSERFSPTCSDTCAGRWSCCGIRGRSTDATRFSSSAAATLAWTFMTSPRTPRNSTPPSLSGTRRIERWRTERPWTWPRCTGASGVKFADSEAHRSSFGSVSMPLTCRGHAVGFSITYANLNRGEQARGPIISGREVRVSGNRSPGRESPLGRHGQERTKRAPASYTVAAFVRWGCT